MDPGLAPLFLSPLLRAGRPAQARDLSRVGLLPGGLHRESYSGFITLDEDHMTNTFFWFFPAKNNQQNAPVILWLEGGCGMSFFISTFNQTGPFKIKPEGGTLNFLAPEFNWTQDHSVIYVDNAIGAGYSFTENPALGYSTTSEHAANGIYEFLKQFFQLFPNLIDNPFHIATFSYGAHFAAPLASQILRENEDGSSGIQVNLVGLIMFAPCLDLVSQSMDFGTYLYNFGLITEEEKAKYDQESLSTLTLSTQKRYREAAEKLDQLIAGTKTYFTESSGFKTNLSVLETRVDLDLLASIIELANKDAFRRAIHVGKQRFSFDSASAKQKLITDTAISVTPHVKEILEKGIPIHIVAGQMDIRANHLGIQRMISKIDWNGSSEFSAAERRQWTVKGDLAGYVKSGGGLTYVMIRNAGHFMIGEKMAWAFDLIKRTVNDMAL